MGISPGRLRAAANTLRGIYTLAGGLREHRWPCNGPVAPFMIASAVDVANPVGGGPAAGKGAATNCRGVVGLGRLLVRQRPDVDL